MDFGKATSRGSWFPGQPESWKKAIDFKNELNEKRRGPSWLGKTQKDFANIAKARIIARQGSWIGNREKTMDDYVIEAKLALLHEKWIKYIQIMSKRRSYGLGKARPRTIEDSMREQHEKGLQDGWIKWKKRLSFKREYGVNKELRSTTSNELRQEEREKDATWLDQMEAKAISKREYGLGQARSITNDEREIKRLAYIQEKGWVLPYMCDSLKKEWVRRYRGSLWAFNKEKSAKNLKKVDDAIEANRIRHLELQWVKNFKEVLVPKFGLGDTKPKIDQDLMHEKECTELENQWEEHTTKRTRKRTEFGLGPRRSLTIKELRKMETDEKLERGWEKHASKGKWNELGNLVWEAKILTLDELEILKIQIELEKNWKRAPNKETLIDEYPLLSWPWEPKAKTKKELKEEKRWLGQENEWLKGRSTYNQIQEGFPTVQDLIIANLEQVWAIEEMEVEVREERKKFVLEFTDPSEKNLHGNSKWENIMMYINDKMEIDFEKLVDLDK